MLLINFNGFFLFIVLALDILYVIPIISSLLDVHFIFSCPSEFLEGQPIILLLDIFSLLSWLDKIVWPPKFFGVIGILVSLYSWWLLDKLLWDVEKGTIELRRESVYAIKQLAFGFKSHDNFMFWERLSYKNSFSILLNILGGICLWIFTID